MIWEAGVTGGDPAVAGVFGSAATGHPSLESPAPHPPVFQTQA